MEIDAVSISWPLWTCGSSSPMEMFVENFTVSLSIIHETHCTLPGDKVLPMKGNRKIVSGRVLVFHCNAGSRQKGAFSWLPARGNWWPSSLKEVAAVSALFSNALSISSSSRPSVLLNSRPSSQWSEPLVPCPLAVCPMTGYYRRPMWLPTLGHAEVKSWLCPLLCYYFSKYC